MTTQALISGLMTAYATDSEAKTCKIVLGKLKEAQKNKALPKRMLKRAVKIVERMNNKLQQN